MKNPFRRHVDTVKKVDEGVGNLKREEHEIHNLNSQLGSLSQHLDTANQYNQVETKLKGDERKAAVNELRIDAYDKGARLVAVADSMKDDSHLTAATREHDRHEIKGLEKEQSQLHQAAAAIQNGASLNILHNDGVPLPPVTKLEQHINPGHPDSDHHDPTSPGGDGHHHTGDGTGHGPGDHEPATVPAGPLQSGPGEPQPPSHHGPTGDHHGHPGEEGHHHTGDGQGGVASGGAPVNGTGADHGATTSGGAPVHTGGSDHHTGDGAVPAGSTNGTPGPGLPGGHEAHRHEAGAHERPPHLTSSVPSEAPPSDLTTATTPASANSQGVPGGSVPTTGRHSSGQSGSGSTGIYNPNVENPSNNIAGSLSHVSPSGPTGPTPAQNAAEANLEAWTAESNTFHDLAREAGGAYVGKEEHAKSLQGAEREKVLKSASEAQAEQTKLNSLATFAQGGGFPTSSSYQQVLSQETTDVKNIEKPVEGGSPTPPPPDPAHGAMGGGETGHRQTNPSSNTHIRGGGQA